MFLESFTLPSAIERELVINNEKRTCYTSFYPYTVFGPWEMPTFTFAPVTIFYGGNGSGKSTILNVLAETIGIERKTPGNTSPFFDRYVSQCRVELRYGCRAVPRTSRFITSDDVFDYLLNLRGLNQGIDRRREELYDEFLSAKHGKFQLQSLDDYEELKRTVDARRLTQSQYVKSRMNAGAQEKSNGESAMTFFTQLIDEHALYLLDEPENSLSATKQAELRDFLAASARAYDCQLVIATHSPFLLSMPGARIYDLDSEGAPSRKWTELENVRAYRKLFREHADEFLEDDEME